MKKVLILIFCLQNIFIFAQTLSEKAEINELKKKIETAKNDSLKIEILNEIIYILNSNDMNYGLALNDQIIEIVDNHKYRNKSEKRNFQILKSLAFNNKGVIYQDNGKINEALREYKKGLEIDLKLNIPKDIGASLLNIGSVYDYLGDYLQAISYFQKSLKIQKKINNKSAISDIYNNIGVTYNTLNQHDKALQYFQLSLNLDRELKDGIAESITLSNIGSVYSEMNEIEKAIEYTKKAHEITLNVSNSTGQGMTLGNIGSYYLELKDYRQAELYLEKAIAIFRESNNSQHLSNFLSYYARVKNIQNQKIEAKKIAHEAYSLAIESNDLSNKLSSTYILYEVYKGLGDAKNALKYYELNSDFEKQTQNDENKRQLLGFEFDKKMAEDSIKNTEKIKLKNTELSLANKKNEQNKERITYLVLGLIILLAMIGFIFNRFQVTKKQKFTIENQKSEVEKQKKIIEEINLQIHDSINYAEMIQQAVLPMLDIEKMFDEALLIYQPKDIVSGDFYWLEKKEQLSYFCVADCTGHGIPGAFISMIGTILLNEIFNSKQITEPNLVLNELSRLVQLTLMTKDNKILNDGMDISFCQLNMDKMELKFAGANNGIYILSSEKELKVNDKVLKAKSEGEQCFLFKIDADKKPIGKHHSNENSFNLKTIQVQKNDLIVLLSDGYVDQFGGPKGKKFKAAQLEDFFLKSFSSSISNLKNDLIGNFLNWKGNQEQVDDVCVILLRV